MFYLPRLALSSSIRWFQLAASGAWFRTWLSAIETACSMSFTGMDRLKSYTPAEQGLQDLTDAAYRYNETMRTLNEELDGLIEWLTHLEEL